MVMVMVMAREVGLADKDGYAEILLTWMAGGGGASTGSLTGAFIAATLDLKHTMTGEPHLPGGGLIHICTVCRHWSLACTAPR